MSKLKRLVCAALAASLLFSTAAQVAPAQQPNDKAAEWVVVSPEGERFGVLMSKQPELTEQRMMADEQPARLRRYAATTADGQATFIVWVLHDPQENGRRLPAADNSAAGVSGESLYLDRMAELAWELLVVPEQERLKVEGDTGRRASQAQLGMSIGRDFRLGGRPAREYAVRLEKVRGLVYVCAEDARIYVVAGLGAEAADPRLKLFADSFTIGERPALPTAATMEADQNLYGSDSTTPSAGALSAGKAGTGTGPGPGGKAGGGGPGPNDGTVDDTRPFRQAEVTKKALVTRKPEPSFTEWARRFNVSGVVRLRATLHSSGEVRNIAVIKSLPHGLTRQALDVAKQIRFEPAQKDGQVVSQYVVLEYYFKIY